jgi:hypothetical protein
MSPEEKQNKFSLWKKDLEERLAKFLFDHPEEKGPVYSPSFSSDSLKRITIEESKSRPGVWIVWENNLILKEFFGPLAQREATKYGGDILNPDPCTFCGMRFTHCVGCINSRKGGSNV